jgi:hypothetical protein
VIAFNLLAVVGLAVMLILNPAFPVAAQSKPPRDPADIQRKVQRSADLQRQALQALGNPAQADRLIGSAYDSLKRAHDDMVINASNMRPPDPLLGINLRKAEQALALVQGARDAFKSSLENPVDVARERLQQALRATNTLLATGF